jgi:hypothetical protein
MSDTASQSAPQHDAGEVRHTLSVHEVGAALTAAGVPRSHRQVIRYCETAMLDAIKVPGPTGEQWYVAPASIPKVIGDLKQWEAQRVRHSQTKLDTASLVQPANASEMPDDTARHGTPGRAVSAAPSSEKASETQPAMARHGQTEVDIFEHPYVQRLEAQVEKWEGKYHEQVRRTEEIQMRQQEKLVELQRMTTIGQSKTLAEFMLQARNWITGETTEPPPADTPNA